MRFRTCLLVSPLIVVLTLGCSSSTPEPDAATTTASSSADPPPKAAPKTAKRKPKIPTQTVGPTGIAP